MTALQQYERLESTGLWRATPDAQLREVGVSFGNATLVIADNAGRALAHWSLPAVEQVSRVDDTVTYAPDTDATETLELSDSIMIDAIETVRKALSRQRPKPGRLRAVSRIALIAGLVAIGVFWLPGALRDQTLAVVTQTKRAEIGATILGHMQGETGQSCRAQQGQIALDDLHARLFGNAAAGRIVVLPSDTPLSVHLPGGLVVLDKSVLRKGDDPATAAGFAIVAQAQANASDPLGQLLDHAGLRETMRLLTTGDLPPEVLKSYAQKLRATPAASLPLEILVEAFDSASVSTKPYASATDTPALADSDPLAGRAVAPILSDGAWVRLQGICDP